MKRTNVNFLTDILCFLFLLSLAATGFVIKYVLPRGYGGGFRGGRGEETIRQFLSMTRHQWMDIHFRLAAAFVILIAIHIILHFSRIKCYIKRLSGQKA